VRAAGGDGEAHDLADRGAQAARGFAMALASDVPQHKEDFDRRDRVDRSIRLRRGKLL